MVEGISTSSERGGLPRRSDDGERPAQRMSSDALVPERDGELW